jgi:hypothetical protein
VTYNFEVLGDEKFQQLCQALLVLEVPHVQCLPVGQPDGGRDGFTRRLPTDRKKGFAVFQVKYVKDPSTKDARDVVEQLIKTEKKKVQRLVSKGASSYYLMTNASGTSHLDAGSVDRVNKLLSDEFSVPTYCWWRDDLERRIDTASSVKWSYPEIIRATDLLEVLIGDRSDPDTRRRTDAIKAYMAHQAHQDAQLKFKQIELQKTIMDLFVDVPSHVLVPPGHDEQGHRGQWSQFFVENSIAPMAALGEGGEEHQAGVGALELMTKQSFVDRAPRVVVEGAPGQGKSTVTQYLCQVNRLLLLNRPVEYQKVAENHRPTTARIPFRVDLRDYASWLMGRDPFSTDTDAKLSTEASPVLESFISAQVRRYTGATFTVDDLTAVTRTSKILIVLDGFDEVAEVRLRNRIVEEVTEASVRIAQAAISSQIIVTSRPAAFANSPGFSREEWQHVEILPLTTRAIEAYALKWLSARDVDEREANTVINTLKEKLLQPHVRDLARNPMQLAILLTLMSVQGASLPNKRTALYDNYIDIFLNRESEKSGVVRDHRDLLLQIHRHLAWELHAAAERSGSGNISESGLKDEIKKFLEENGHEVDLVNLLFTGMVERIVALVSRVQGTFEFEVQPLREYFAARHLYDTAPYIQAGTQSRGALPERFDQLARNFYWLNVTRFYAGCYSSGELSSLIDGIEDLSDSRHIGATGYPARLGIALLSDYVFSQQPKLSAKLIKKIIEGRSFKTLMAETQSTHSYETFRVPAGPGRAALVDFAKNLLRSKPIFSVMHSASRILVGNCSYQERVDTWLELKAGASVNAWLAIGLHLQILQNMPTDKAVALLSEHAEAAKFFVDSERLEILDEVPSVWHELFLSIVSGRSYFFPGHDNASRSPLRALADKMSYLLMPFMFEELESENFGAISVREVIAQYLAGSSSEGFLQDSGGYEDQSLALVSETASKVLDLSWEDFLSGPDAYSAFLEACRVAWGDGWALYAMAIVYVSHITEPVVPEADLFDSATSLCHRASAAKKHARDLSWWRQQFRRAVSANGQNLHFVLACAVQWLHVEELLVVSEELSLLVDQIATEDWATAARQARYVVHTREPRRVAARCFPTTMSPRLAAMLVPFVQGGARRQIWKKYLRDYEGHNGHVIDMRCALAIEEAGNDVAKWEVVLTMLSEATLKRISLPLVALDEDLDRQVPVSVAEAICAEPENYPYEIVAAGSAALAAEVGRNAVPIFEVAKRDAWLFN